MMPTNNFVHETARKSTVVHRDQQMVMSTLADISKVMGHLALLYFLAVTQRSISMLVSPRQETGYGQM